MELIQANNMPDDFDVYDISDLHVGSPNCSEESLMSVIEEIKNSDNSYFIFKGDAIECILPNDKRYVHSAVKNDLKSPQDQSNRVIEMFKDVGDKCLAWGIGNHEYKLWNTMDFGKYMADAIGAPYGAYNFKISYFDKSDQLMFKTYHTHGMGGVNSNAKDAIQYEANRRAGLKHKLAKSGHADVIYMSRGHDHQLIVVDPTAENQLFLTDDGSGIHQHYRVSPPQNADYIPPDSRWYATTGSFRKLYSRPGLGVTDYGEIVGYAPSEIGFAKMIVRNKKLVDVIKVVCT